MAAQTQEREKGKFWRGAKREDFLFLLAMAAAGVFLFWKCRYGFANRDEAFYLTIPYRLYQGDALFEEEWHLSQMSGVLLFPFVAGYMKLFGSTDGILLAFRYLCTSLWWVNAFFLYGCLRKYSRVGATAGALSYVLYIPFGIMAFSYNSLGIFHLLIAMALTRLPGKDTSRGKACAAMAFSGIFFSAAVLCCPYLAAVYALYSAAAAIRWLLRYFFGKLRGDVPEGMFWLTGKGWFWFSVGVAVSAAAFLIFVLSRASLKNVIEAFTYIFQDPEHRQRAFSDNVASYVRQIFYCGNLAKPLFRIIAVLLAVVILDRGRQKRRGVYLTMVCMISLALLVSMLREKTKLNFIMYPVNIFGLFCFFFTDKRGKELFYVFWIPGMLYSFLINMTSNQGLYAIASASVTAGVGSTVLTVMTAWDLMKSVLGRQPVQGAPEKELSVPHQIFCCAAAVYAVTFLVIWIVSEAILRYQTVFWEPSMASQNILLEEGPEAGIYAAADKDTMYREFLEDTKVVREDPAVKTVLYLSKNTWLYLCDDAGCGGYSAWPSGVNDQMLYRLEGYYRINPEKLPDAVYSEAEYEEQADLFCEKFGYQKEAAGRGFVLYPAR